MEDVQQPQEQLLLQLSPPVPVTCVHTPLILTPLSLLLFILDLMLMPPTRLLPLVWGSRGGGAYLLHRGEGAPEGEGLTCSIGGEGASEGAALTCSIGGGGAHL